MRSASEGVLRRYPRYARAAAGGILVNEDGSAEGAAHLTKRAAKEGRLRPPLRYPYVRATRSDREWSTKIRGLVMIAQTSVRNGADTHLRRFYHDVQGKS